MPTTTDVQIDSVVDFARSTARYQHVGADYIVASYVETLRDFANSTYWAEVLTEQHKPDQRPAAMFRTPGFEAAERSESRLVRFRQVVEHDAGYDW